MIDWLKTAILSMMGVTAALAVVILIVSAAVCAQRQGEREAVDRYKRSRELVSKCIEADGEPSKCEREFGNWAR